VALIRTPQSKETRNKQKKDDAMPNTATETEMLAVADALVTASTSLKSTRVTINQVIESNSNHSIDWLDVAINQMLLDKGKDYDGTDLTNIVSSLDDLRGAWWAVHGPNVDKMTPPIVK